MNPLKGACIIGQSGGPTASALGAIQSALQSEQVTRVLGAANGIEGVLKERLFDMAREDPGELELLKYTPASALGSCRYKMAAPSVDDTDYRRLLEIFRKYDVRYFFYNGGNDSMDTVLKLSNYAKKIGSDIRIIGIPKTIDNDLMETDHTPGFGSAAKYIASSILEIAHDTFIYAVKSVTIVEIMGRDAGWLTAASALARNEYSTAPHLIYLPEVAFDKDAFLRDVKKLLETTNNVIVAISEGIHDADGNYISASESSTDTFGHSQLSGAGKCLEYMIKENIHVKVRSVEVNVLQRCASHLSSKTDLDESFLLGEKAVACAEEGLTASMVTLKRTSNTPYQVSYGHARIESIANEAKSVPTEWISEAGNDIREPLLDYLRPLIQGEVPVTYKNGLPVYMNVSHLSNSKPLN